MARRIRPVLEPEPNEQLYQRLVGMSHDDLVDLVVALVARDPANERLVATSVSFLLLRISRSTTGRDDRVAQPTAPLW